MCATTVPCRTPLLPLAAGATFGFGRYNPTSSSVKLVCQWSWLCTWSYSNTGEIVLRGKNVTFQSLRYGAMISGWVCMDAAAQSAQAFGATTFMLLLYLSCTYSFICVIAHVLMAKDKGSMTKDMKSGIKKIETTRWFLRMLYPHFSIMLHPVQWGRYQDASGRTRFQGTKDLKTSGCGTWGFVKLDFKIYHACIP